MSYTRDQIIGKCTEAFKDIKTFYKQSFINYRGITEDTDEYFTEVIAEFLCSHIAQFTDGIDTITREETYKTEGHDGIPDNPGSNRKEELIAMAMYNKTYDLVGRMLDYQTPLKNKSNDEAGKIDLLAYDGKALRILELKKPDSDETMLRCVLEAFTYWKTVDKPKLLSDFNLPADTVIKACPFVFKDGEQHNEIKKARPHLKRLMSLLDSKPYYISVTDNYIVTEDSEHEKDRQRKFVARSGWYYCTCCNNLRVGIRRHIYGICFRSHKRLDGYCYRCYGICFSNQDSNKKS